jgi:hypothetical protein
MPTTAASAAPPPASTGTLQVFAEKAVAAPGSLGFLSTSDRVILLEVAAAVLLVSGAVALASSGGLALPGVDVHPLWIPVLVFAARYGVRGMFTAVGMGTAALAVSSLVVHGGLRDVAARSSNPYDMMALMAATLVAWTAMMRDRRLARAAQDQEEISRRLATSEETADALREVVGVLRHRLDRIDLSISMWRAIAWRLDHGSPADAAAAALELAAIRAGAATGEVHRNIDGRLDMIATCGHGPTTSDAARDATARQAVALRRTALRRDVPGATLADSEVAVPVLDPDSRLLLGVLTMRDAPTRGLRAAEVRDLEVVAAWLALAFSRPEPDSEEAAC